MNFRIGINIPLNAFNININALYFVFSLTYNNKRTLIAFLKSRKTMNIHIFLIFKNHLHNLKNIDNIFSRNKCKF